MSAESTTADGTPDNVLFRLYERYVGDPEAEVDVYLGFALFFGGIALGVVGVATFLLSSSQTGIDVYHYREVASVAAAASLPVILLGVVTLLPGDRRMLYVALAGAAVCGVAIGLFTQWYPYSWNVANGPDYSVRGVAVYAVGLVAVVGATGAALVGHRVERARSGPAPAAGDAEAATDETGAPATDPDEDVEARAESDYERAVEGAEVSWGGVERTETRRLELNTEGVDDVDRRGFDDATATEARGEGVDDAVSGLRRMQGREATTTGTGGGTDDQAAALSELREQQAAEELATEDDDGVVERIRSLFD
jgi:hypothetical protein